MKLPVTRVPPISLSGWSRYGVGTQQNTLNGGTSPSSTTWNAANLALFIPMVFDHAIVIDKMWWINGNTQANAVSLAVYDESWNRLATTGSQTQAGAVGTQTADLSPDVLITPGRYYLAMSCNSNASQFISENVNALRLQQFGVMEQTAAHVLPNPAAPSFTARTYIPLIGITPRWP